MPPTAKRRRAPTASRRGRLMPLRVTPGFRDYVLEQLSGLGRVHARSMFGGVGLYADEVFFGILAADVLYFKVTDANRAAYDTAEMPAFKPYAERSITMSYRQVPVGVLEDADELARWAGAAIRAARGGGGSRTPERSERSERLNHS